MQVERVVVSTRQPAMKYPLAGELVYREIVKENACSGNEIELAIRTSGSKNAKSTLAMLKVHVSEVSVKTTGVLFQ